MKFLCILLITSQFCLAQTIFIKDKLTKEEVPYAIVKLDSLGFYTDVNGSLDISNQKFEHIWVTHLNYEDHKINAKNLSDTLWLEPKDDYLDEVIIRDFSMKKQKRLKAPSKYFSVVLFKNSETISCLCPKKDFENVFITKFKFDIDKRQNLIEKDKLEKISISIRLNLYNIENWKPAQIKNSILFEKLSINDMLENKHQLILEFENQAIALNEQGFCFGIEVLGYFEGDKKIDVNSLIINTSKNKSKYFDSKLYLRYPINDNKLVRFDEFHKRDFEIFNFKHIPVLIPEIILYE